MQTLKFCKIMTAFISVASSSFAEDFSSFPEEVKCKIAIRADFNNLVKQVTVFGSLSLPFSNTLDYPIKTITVSVHDKDGNSLFTNDMVGEKQTVLFLAGAENEPTPIEPGVTTALSNLKRMDEVLWSMNLFGMDDETAIKEAASLMASESNRLRNEYKVVSCYIEGLTTSK